MNLIVRKGKAHIVGMLCTSPQINVSSILQKYAYIAQCKECSNSNCHLTPDIHGKQGGLALRNRVLSIGRFSHSQLVSIFNEPGPTRTCR